ncbi:MULTISPECIES: exodeoxyribonuclease VII small subunit [Streptomyces]|uniref:exodeoxyribonuclease VII small subunit n=1 Tax=Streptomyces TaxID=1883 RepID=UPI001D133A44|nr:MULTISPECIES: exodeoxyribonuclease VII small subunit [Streptomyces]MCC3651954.1 exodeoxyribonuclease VII small subunit [Streptomyces sp. S07_1.15]WSQ73322.1 exodeoxyribonuclease VII small subunit [Streptomyces xinghaiensis]
MTETGTGAAAPSDALGYEQARDELIDVVRRLEAGGTTLEESLALWERGEELSKICRRWLDGARARLDAALAESSEEGSGPSGGAPRGSGD